LPQAADMIHAISIAPPDKSVSIFGDTSYKFFDRLTLGAGVRYYKNWIGTSYSSCCDAVPVFMPNPKADFDSVDPRFYALYRVSDALNIYTSAAKGFRSGGVNGFDPNGVALPNFGPESVWTYELGAKGALFDGRFTADGAVFYTDYKDYQINGLLPPPAPPFNFTRNGGAAWVRGVEWDLTWHPGYGWYLSFNGNVLKTRFYKIAVLEGAYNVGDGLDLVPDHTITVSAQRDFTWNDKQGFARLDYSQVGPETFRNRSIGDYYFGETHNINMLNFTVGLQWTDKLSLGLFAQNLLNDQNFTNPSYIEGANKSRPRTFGANFAVKFD
jgi:outer membrane receptor protein involved in Fe transport